MNLQHDFMNEAPFVLIFVVEQQKLDLCQSFYNINPIFGYLLLLDALFFP